MAAGAGGGRGGSGSAVGRPRAPHGAGRHQGQGVVQRVGSGPHLGVHKSTIGRWIKEGLLPVVKLPNGKSRIPRATFQEFLRKYNPPAP